MKTGNYIYSLLLESISHIQDNHHNLSREESSPTNTDNDGENDDEFSTSLGNSFDQHDLERPRKVRRLVFFSRRNKKFQLKKF